MPNRKKTGDNNIAPDITHVVRSVQRLEGNPDCFRKAADGCDRLDCAWRELCLEKKVNYDGM